MGEEKKKTNGVKKTKGIGKILLFVVILLILASLTAGGVYLYLKTTNERDSVATSTFVGMFEDGTYYIPKAKKNIRFQVESEDVNSYKIIDKNGNYIETKIAKKNGKNYIQAIHSYQEGQTYLLELNNTSFSEETLKNAKKLEFKIETSAKSEYEFADNVKTINKHLDIKENENIKTLEVNELNISQNDIILTNDFAYKVNKVENGIATLTIPEPTEVYKTFEMHEERVVDFSNFVVNPEFEKEIRVSVEKSPIYQFFVSECYAADIAETQVVKPTKEGINIEINLTLKADGNEYLGIKALANHDLILKFIVDLSCKANEDIVKGNSINLDLAMTESFSFDVELKSNGTILKGIGELSDEEYCRTVQDIVAKLESASTDKSDGSVFIGGVTIPTQIPFVYIKADVFLQRALELQTNFHYQQTVVTSQNIGFTFDNQGIRPYFYLNSPKSSSEMTVLGKARAELGLGFDIGVQVLNADIMVRTEGGFYAELFAAMNVAYNNTDKNLNENFVGKIEAGIYFRNKITASLDVIFTTISKEVILNDVDIPLLKIGNDDITTGIEPETENVEIGNNNYITLPTIIRNIKKLSTGKTRKVKCTENLYLTDANGKSVSLSGNMATLNKNEDTIVYIEYHEGSRIYRTQINAKKKNAPSNATDNGEIVDTNPYSKVKGDYQNYIRNKKYVPKTADWNEPAETYCIYDINQDGTEELLIMSGNDGGWRNTLIYTSLAGNITLVDNIYSYGEIRYDKDEKEIVYAQIKPYIDVGIYNFYKLKNARFVHSKSVGYEDRGKYVVVTGSSKKSITEQQSQAYFKKLYYFSFKNLSNA